MKNSYENYIKKLFEEGYVDLKNGKPIKCFNCQSCDIKEIDLDGLGY